MTKKEAEQKLAIVSSILDELVSKEMIADIMSVDKRFGIKLALRSKDKFTNPNYASTIDENAEYLYQEIFGFLQCNKELVKRRYIDQGPEHTISIEELLKMREEAKRVIAHLIKLWKQGTMMVAAVYPMTNDYYLERKNNDNELELKSVTVHVDHNQHYSSVDEFINTSGNYERIYLRFFTRADGELKLVWLGTKEKRRYLIPS